jgi:hypothetical protein
LKYDLTMSVSLEQLAQILVKVRISSSHEEEILTVAQSLNTPPETNEELTSEELEEDNEEMQHDLSEGNCTYERFIDKWFQVSTHLDKFHFFSLLLQQQNSFILVNFHFTFEKFPLNIFLLLLREWLHWLFDYT